MANRLHVFEEILKEFKENSPEFVALHWDDKLIQKQYDEKHDASFIIASGPLHFKEGKLLGVQQLENASGEAQAEATYELVQMWD